MLTEHKEVCLRIIGAESVRLEKGTNKFKILVPFKIYADLECDLDNVENYENSYSKKYQDHIPCISACQLVCVDDKFTEPIVVFRGENAAFEFIKATLKEYEYCKKVAKKYLNKNLIMNEKEEEQNQLSNMCYICGKLIENDDEKVMDHSHISKKVRGAGSVNQKSCCNISQLKRL